jgi:hypothetical protein
MALLRPPGGGTLGHMFLVCHWFFWALGFYISLAFCSIEILNRNTPWVEGVLVYAGGLIIELASESDKFPELIYKSISPVVGFDWTSVVSKFWLLGVSTDMSLKSPFLPSPFRCARGDYTTPLHSRGFEMHTLFGWWWWRTVICLKCNIFSC